MKFYAVMLDETGCEFGVDVTAQDKSWARQMLNEDYPESRCIQLESPQEIKDREKAIYDHINEGGDWDDEGRPIYHYNQEEDEDDQY